MQRTKSRKYDEDRKKESRKQLLKAITSLSALDEHKTKPITKNELSKKTGISRATIDRYPDVIERLHEVNSKIREEKVLDYVAIDSDKITSLDEARIIIDAMSGLLNEQSADLQKYIKLNTTKDIEIAKLRDEKNELKGYLESIKEVK